MSESLEIWCVKSPQLEEKKVSGFFLTHPVGDSKFQMTPIMKYGHPQCHQVEPNHRRDTDSSNAMYQQQISIEDLQTAEKSLNEKDHRNTHRPVV